MHGPRMRMARFPLACAALAMLFAAGSTRLLAGAQQVPQDLKIVVVAGEDGVNIIKQKSAIKPVVEVRDRNDLPVAGVPVTFSIASGGASFGGASSATVVTNAAGRAAITQLTPSAAGQVQIHVQAVLQGQTATATITQTNYMTAAEAANAGHTAAQSAGKAGSGGGGGLSHAAIAGIAGGAAAGGLVVYKAAQKAPPCTFSVSPTTLNAAPSSATSFTVNIDVSPAGCEPATWTTSSSQSFVSVSPAGGTGSGTVTINVAGNTVTTTRSAAVTVAGTQLNVSQAAFAPPCNSQQVAGGDVPETRTIELGRRSGTVTFTYNTQNVEDRMLVVYEGRTLFDTTCVGTGTDRSTNISYSGNSTQMTVQVQPNCRTNSSGTFWSFTLACPR